MSPSIAAVRSFQCDKTHKAKKAKVLGGGQAAGSRLRKLAAMLIIVALIAGCESGNSAQRELRHQQDQAFQAMLAQPGNVELAMAYAGAATRAGDYEGAVAAYEGILMTDSDQPRIKLELGILYFRLKSYEMSRSYLEAALKSTTLSADVRKPAEQLLAKMPTRG
jgi:tetratricopeptide (TPR) repeat protein